MELDADETEALSCKDDIEVVPRSPVTPLCKRACKSRLIDVQSASSIENSVATSSVIRLGTSARVSSPTSSMVSGRGIRS